MNKPEKTKFGSIKSAMAKNNKLTAGISFLLLFLIMFGFFAFIITGLYHFGLIEFPAFIQDLFFKTDGEKPEPEKDDKNIYDFLALNSPENNADGSESLVAEITLENTRDAIANTKLPDNLHLEIEARYYINGEISRTEELSFWKKGDKCKYLLSVDFVPEESYINDSKYEQFENFVSGSRSPKKAAALSLGDIPHMPDINRYLDLFANGEITDYSLAQNDDSNILEITYVLPQINQRELIRVSLDTGVVLEARSFSAGPDGERMFYSCETEIVAAYYDGDTNAGAAAPIPDFLFDLT